LNLETITKKVEDDLEQMSLFCKKLGATDYQLPPELLRLHYSLRIVQNKQKAIENVLLPYPADCKIPVLAACISSYNDEEMIKYLSALFAFALREYRLLVDTNFPALKESMETYKILPARVIAEIEKESGRFRGVTYCIIPSENKDETEIKIKEDKSIFDDKPFSVQTSKGITKLRWYSRSAIHTFFDSDSSRDNIIQKMVYKMVHDDLKQIFKW